MSVKESNATPAAVQIRYWAAAREAAGTASESVPWREQFTLAEVQRVLRERHPGDRFARILDVCSVLVGEQPLGRTPPEDVVLHPGVTVDLLPPFAGG